MRKISLESKMSEIVWIGILIVVYFMITNSVRFWIIGMIGFLILYFVSIIFFSTLPTAGKYKDILKRVIITWSYALLPTLIWFYSTLLFYFIIPPPRTISFLGKAFSIFYIAFSASLLIWKLILIYLSVRFSLRVHLYRIFYYLLLYFALSIPLWVVLYIYGISRIPFV